MSSLKKGGKKRSNKEGEPFIAAATWVVVEQDDNNQKRGRSMKYVVSFHVLIASGAFSRWRGLHLWLMSFSFMMDFFSTQRLRMRL